MKPKIFLWRNFNNDTSLTLKIVKRGISDDCLCIYTKLLKDNEQFFFCIFRTLHKEKFIFFVMLKQSKKFGQRKSFSFKTYYEIGQISTNLTYIVT